MATISIRPQRVSDTKRFYDILNNDNFKYFPVRPKTLEEQRKFLRNNDRWRKENSQHNYSIIYDGLMVGAVGIKINPHRPYVGEIGYLLDEKYWGRGIVVRAVRQLERIAFDTLKIRRIEILMDVRHKASMRVAEKAGYLREGRMRKVIKNRDKFLDAYLYAKTK
jgi:[ribosomal protein S5]-alanine N-acetyltransferase